MTGRVRIVEGGIVLQDFSGCTDAEEAMRYVTEARQFMESLPRNGEVLVLTDVSGSSFNQELVDAIRDLAAHHRPWVKASAVVGLTALTSIVYRVIVALTRREIRVCGSRDEAVAYLKTRAASDPSTKGGASPRRP